MLDFVVIDPPGGIASEVGNGWPSGIDADYNLFDKDCHLPDADCHPSNMDCDPWDKDCDLPSQRNS